MWKCFPNCRSLCFELFTAFLKIITRIHKTKAKYENVHGISKTRYTEILGRELQHVLSAISMYKYVYCSEVCVWLYNRDDARLRFALFSMKRLLLSDFMLLSSVRSNFIDIFQRNFLQNQFLNMRNLCNQNIHEQYSLILLLQA